MNDSRIRSIVCATCDSLLRHRAAAIPPGQFSQPALVFAPHPDDEILGCGGTVSRKIAAGARVGVVFLTDGCHSPKCAGPAEARRIRAAEAHHAAAVLGVLPADICFLDFPDGQLHRHVASASRKVRALLQKYEPAEVFFPYRGDAHPDHRASYLTVRLALQQFRKPLRAYEYPVWFWNRWPWVSQDAFGWRRIPAAIRDMIAFLRLLADMSVCVPIADTLPVKQAALSQYRSQMSRDFVGPGGITLYDFADGEFLRRFFREREYFSVHPTDWKIACPFGIPHASARIEARGSDESCVESFQEHTGSQIL